MVPAVTVILLSTLALVLYLGHRREELARVQALEQRISIFVPPAAIAAGKGQQARPRALGGLAFTEELQRRIDRWLTQAGMKIPAFKFAVLVTMIAVAAWLLIRLWVSSSLAVVYGLTAGGLPLAYVQFKRNQRLTTFSQQLPYVLDFLRSSLSAGHTLVRGVQMATENAPEPIAGELKLVVDQIQLGTSLGDALDSMLKRAPEESLGFLVAAVRIQAQVGSSIGEILDRVTDTIRERQRLQQEIKSLTAQARMSGMIVAALPFILLGFFTLVRPSYTYPLFHEHLGQRMLEAAVVLDVISMLIIRRMVQVD
jgi:tight adherence protein B